MNEKNTKIKSNKRKTLHRHSIVFLFAVTMQNKILQWKFPKRYIIVIMVFLGYINFYYLHVNIGMVAVHVTSTKRILHDNGTVVLRSEYNWNSKQKALVLSSFAYGRFLGPIGGALSGRIGGSTMYGIGIFVTSLITIFSPFFLHINFYLFVVTTALTGTFESFSYASVSQLWSRWAPPDERAKCISISVIGIYGGSIVSFVVAGSILNKWGWETLFYVSGAATFIWGCIWCLVVKDDPSIDKYISDEERRYIKEKLNPTSYTDKVVYPWKKIFTCAPFWAGCLCKTCMGVGYTFTMMYLPQYIKDTNDIDIKKIGYISVIPQLCAVIAMPLCGYISDYIRSNKILSLTRVHKLYVSIGLISGAIAFTVAGLWPNFIICIMCLSIFQFFSTFTILDILVLPLDLAPRYAAFMNAVANSFHTAACFVTPVFVGFMVTSHEQSQWSMCFLSVSFVFLLVDVIFLKFGSGELQDWANSTPSKHKEKSIQDEDSTEIPNC